MYGPVLADGCQEKSALYAAARFLNWVEEKMFQEKIHLCPFPESVTSLAAVANLYPTGDKLSRNRTSRREHKQTDGSDDLMEPLPPPDFSLGEVQSQVSHISGGFFTI